jgi:PAS domain S-box-containing protein
MVDTARPAGTASLRRDAILEAVAFAAERLLLADDWREAADDVVTRLGIAADVSRAYIVENHLDDEGRVASTPRALWCAPGITAEFEDPSPNAFPWTDGGFGRWVEVMSRGDLVEGEVTSFPESEQRELTRREIVSLASFPVFVANTWWGCIGFDDCVGVRDWSGAELDALRAAASVLGAAVQRQRAETQRRDAEERYRQLMDRIPAVTYTDIPRPEGGVDMGFVSPQIEQVLGYPAERFMRERSLWVSLIHPEDVARLDAIGAFDPADSSPFDHEYRMLAADGRTVWVHDTSAAVFRDDGTLDYFLGFMTDVTQRIRAEEQLHQTEERFRIIVERTPVISYQEPHFDGPYEATTRMTYVSPQIETILGYTPDEWSVASFWIERLHPDDRETVMAESMRTVSAGEPYRQDYRVIASDGRVVWFHDDAVLLRDDRGEPLFWQGVMLDITYQKEAEQRLRAAEERYRALVEHVPAVVYAEALDAGAGELYLSPQVTQVFGYSAEEWRAAPHFWTDHIHPDDLPGTQEVNQAANLSGEPYVCEYRFMAADGSYRWVHDEAVRVRGDDSEPLFWQGVLLDITQQREAEEALREAEARFRALVEHIPAVVYTESPDADPAKFYLSPQVETLLGHTPAEWTWTKDFWADHIHPDDRQGALARDAESDRTRESYAGDYRFLRKDGRWVWVHDEASFVQEPGEEGFWQGFMLDITQRKEAEDRLREAELKFRTIVEQNQAIFYTQEIDPEDPTISTTTYIAPGNTDMIGYTLADVQADPTLWRKIIHPDDRERVFRADADSNTGGGDRFSLEYRMIAKDGRIVWVQDEATLVHLPGKHPYWQGFLLDITERKEAETQLERALAVEREATQRLRTLDEMKNTFLQAVSHDLRTPLAAILGLAITLERGDVHLAEDDSRDLARRIADNARRLDRLVTNLLDLDRLARGIVAPKLQPTDVGALVSRILDESELLAKPRLLTDIQSVVIPIDTAKVERIVENLVANTVRHTPSNATIWVSVRPSSDPDGVVIAVEDNGAGVLEEMRETIFEPFQQGPEAPQHSPGVGVGLTLVRRFAELHGGRAWVETRDGGGASFRVFLPAVAPEA